MINHSEEPPVKKEKLQKKETIQSSTPIAIPLSSSSPCESESPTERTGKEGRSGIQRVRYMQSIIAAEEVKRKGCGNDIRKRNERVKGVAGGRRARRRTKLDGFFHPRSRKEGLDSPLQMTDKALRPARGDGSDASEIRRWRIEDVEAESCGQAFT